MFKGMGKYRTELVTLVWSLIQAQPEKSSQALVQHGFAYSGSLESVHNLRVQVEEETVPIRASMTGQGRNQRGEASSGLSS